MNEPVLTDGDSFNPLWLKLKAHFEARLEVLRSQNDGNLDPEATAKMRGRIAEVKYFIGLDKPTDFNG